MESFKDLTLKGLLISFLIHMGLGIFIFTFSARPIAHKPFIVSLGSILSRHELIINEPWPTDLSVDSVKKASKMLKFPENDYTFDQIPIKNKPSYRGVIPQHDKKYLKAPIGETLIDVPPQQEGMDIEKEQTLPPRQPLKLNPS